jgi:predicted secreted Zn-dependent protease
MPLKEAIAEIDILHAVATLEYHDMNWLSWDNKRRNEEKRRLMRSVKARLETMEAAERQPTGKVQKSR